MTSVEIKEVEGRFRITLHTRIAKGQTISISGDCNSGYKSFCDCLDALGEKTSEVIEIIRLGSESLRENEDK